VKDKMMQYTINDLILTPNNINIAGIRFTPSRLCRIETKIRRLLFSQHNVDCHLINIFRQAFEGTNLNRCAIKTPSATRTFFFRNKTTDKRVIEQIFHAKTYNMTGLARFTDIKRLLETKRQEGRWPLIVDAGANIGASSVFFSLTFPGALVVAIEPEKNNHNLLCKNVEGLNVVTMNAALSSEDGRAVVFDAGIGQWGYRTKKTTSEASVSCVTIGGLYEKFVGEEYFPFLVKIDIEGGEKDVFEKNTEWIARTPIVIVELHDWMLPRAGTSLPFLRCMSSLDRDFIYLGEDIFSIDNAVSSSQKTI
jgi:FkbM family methyltransferase